METRKETEDETQRKRQRRGCAQEQPHTSGRKAIDETSECQNKNKNENGWDNSRRLELSANWTRRQHNKGFKYNCEVESCRLVIPDTFNLRRQTLRMPCQGLRNDAAKSYENQSILIGVLVILEFEA
eukprot:746943-Hanusia_phi.AAC.4